MYQELGLESLSDRRWYRRLVQFFLIITHNSPEHLHIFLPNKQQSYDPTRNNLFRTIVSHTDYFKNSFFPYCVSEWNKLGHDLQNSISISVFKKALLVFIRPIKHPIYKIVDPTGLKLLTRLRVSLSHLRKHKFQHNFLDTINPLCSCRLEVESTCHYLLRCSSFACFRKTLLDNIINLIGTVSNLSDDNLVQLLLYGDKIYSLEVNASILKYTIIF